MVHNALLGFARFALEPVILFVWAALLATLLWLTRRYIPRAERFLFGPLYNLFHAIGWQVGRAIRRVLRALL